MVLKLDYKDKFWDVSLPTVRAYHFDQDSVGQYLSEDRNHPLVFDTNLVNGCNTNCIYCSTLGGKYDVRYPEERALDFVSGKEYKEVIRQMSKLGVKTFFICSNGEPLLNPKRFISLAREAHSNGLRTITYTNGTTLTEDVLKQLEEVDVNIVMKLESLNPQRNDGIILNTPDQRKKIFTGYKYVDFRGQKVPDSIPRAFEIYGDDTSRLGLETMIVNNNVGEVLDIRKWAYDELDCAQFLKHVYPLGYIQLRGQDVQPTEGRKMDIDRRVIELDLKYGLRYPSFPTPDHFSFDARRLMNNLASGSGFPFRIFAHERGGVYHSSQLVEGRAGFGTETIIKLSDDSGQINMGEYFTKISDFVRREDVWRPKAV